jgi:predicted porin
MKKYLVALAAFMAVAPAASAADLNPGGNCCSDLEERIAELEATAAKKGNRKVSLIVYGEVNKAILFTADDQHVIDNTSNETRVGFAAEGRIGNIGKAGAILELHTNYRDTGEGVFIDPVDGNSIISVRRAAVYVDSSFGRVTWGLYDTSTHDLLAMTTANTTPAVRPLNILGYEASTGIQNLVRYDSPTLAGFVVSASWAPDASDDLWSVALRYGGLISDVKLSFGAGMDFSGSDKLFTLTGSAMHTPTGIFVTANFQRADYASANAFQVTAGLERRFFDFGATTVYGEYARLEAGFDLADGPTVFSDTDAFGVGIVQAIDGAGIDLYASYRRFDDTDMAMTGARVKF